MKPKVSVVLPAYNAEKYIAQSIESILGQTFKDFELIIINDCSQDKTWGIIEKFAKRDKRILAISNTKNLKLANSLNKGIELAKGKYIARMDADDWSYPDRLETQYRFMEKHPKVGIVGGSMNVCSEDLKITNSRSYPVSDKKIRSRIFFYSPFSHPLIMIRKDVLDKVGGYDTAFNPAEDYELYFRIGSTSKFANLRKVLLKYRVVPNSMTTGGTKKMEVTSLRIRTKYFDTYQASLIARIFTLLQSISVSLIPYNLKAALFNYVRSRYE